MKQKILVVTPKFPYPSYGACEQDRAAGIEMLIEMGFDVYLITKVYGEGYKHLVREVAERLGITIVPVNYRYLASASSFEKIKNILWRVVQPWYLDGAAFEYSEPEIEKATREALESFKPDIVWFDYTYLWPLYGLVKKVGIPIITRSINFEPIHFLEEDGRTFWNYIKFLPKLLSEYIVSKKSDIIFAITPKEKKIYERIGAKKVTVLPLRGLSSSLSQLTEIKERSPLNVFFSGSTYNVVHNRVALEFLLKQIIPRAQQQFPGQFIFHIFGGKVPSEFDQYFSRGIERHDYLSREVFGNFMKDMDIALIPSLCGAGMQQKIFEPLCRGLPTITSPRGLAGYPFQDRKHLLLASAGDDFVRCLGDLRDAEFRQKLSSEARLLAANIFDKERIVKIISNSLEELLKS